MNIMNIAILLLLLFTIVESRNVRGLMYRRLHSKKMITNGGNPNDVNYRHQQKSKFASNYDNLIQLTSSMKSDSMTTSKKENIENAKRLLKQLSSGASRKQYESLTHRIAQRNARKQQLEKLQKPRKELEIQRKFDLKFLAPLI